MKLQGNGWFSEYLNYRKLHYKEQRIKLLQHPDFSLYSLLQPTGILYGNPMQSENLEKGSFIKLDERSRLKILLAESLVNSYLLFHKDSIRSAKEFEKQLNLSLKSIIDFFTKVYPEISVSRSSLFGKKKSDAELAERIIEKRIDLKAPSQDNFWIRFFSNSLIFLDIYFFGQWIHTATDSLVSAFFQDEKEDLRLTVIKVIIAAAHANDIVEVEEKKLFEYILHSAQLTKNRRKTAWALLENGIQVEEISWPDNNSWLLKKFFLELAILTVSADRVIDKSEKEFLVNFTKHLGFFEEDLEKSIMAIEGFLIENWDDIGELQSRTDYRQMSIDYESKILNVIGRSEKKLMQEISERDAIMRLLAKYNSAQIDEAEEDRLRIKLLEILKKLPSFVSMALPESFLTLPTLLKILPIQKLESQN